MTDLAAVQHGLEQACRALQVRAVQTPQQGTVQLHCLARRTRAADPRIIVADPRDHEGFHCVPSCRKAVHNCQHRSDVCRTPGRMSRQSALSWPSETAPGRCPPACTSRSTQRCQMLDFRHCSPYARLPWPPGHSSALRSALSCARGRYRRASPVPTGRQASRERCSRRRLHLQRCSSSASGPS